MSSNKSRKIPLAVLAAMLVTGCAKLGPDFVKPAAPVPKSWVENSAKLKQDPAIPQNWWTVFKDPVLDRLIDTARTQNLTLRIAGLRILEARARLGLAVGNLYPQLQQARGGVSYEKTSENQANTAGTDLNNWNFNLGFDAVWELDFWGRNRRGVESADASLRAIAADYDDVLVSLTAEVARAYVAIRTFENRVRLAAENAEQQRRALNLAETRFRNGDTTELDVLQARSLVNTTLATIPRFKTGLRQAQNALATLLAISPGKIQAVLGNAGAIPDAPSEVVVGVPAELLRRRPDVRQAELRAAAQSALVGVAEADLYPRFTLNGSIGITASDGTNTTQSGQSGLGELFTGGSLALIGGPAFTWNIFNYGRIKNNVRVQDARLQQRLVAYRNTVLKAAQEAEDAMVGFLRSHEEVALLGSSVEAATRSVDLSLIQYQEGSVDFQRVLDSQNRLVIQQDQWTEARGNVSRNLIAMYKALGGGWQVEKGHPLVPEATLEEMRQRTDWGDVLNSPEVRKYRAERGSAGIQKVDW